MSNVQKNWQQMYKEQRRSIRRTQQSEQINSFLILFQQRAEVVI